MGGHSISEPNLGSSSKKRHEPNSEWVARAGLLWILSGDMVAGPPTPAGALLPLQPLWVLRDLPVLGERYVFALGSMHTGSLEKKMNSKGNVFLLKKKNNMLDGFPRLLVEAEFLASWALSRLYLELPTDTLVKNP